ncbi:YjbH domain-containing protein [Yoonia sp. F2084L]|uniref:YjbH domain-containing protein n=1 Tax=Yoonia sp. F2084L TaxID=2926419 RepID=UPI001FF6F5EE|nr:YjbH domain-containing protein [Yoonia sp. F2084L]MCK0097152.1 YjbH domain-containing protein [Yoonia sp. F2084L]
MSTDTRPYRKRCGSAPLAWFMLAFGVAQAGHAQDADTTPSYTYNLFGTPGLIDMPTAQTAQDAELAATIGYFAGSTRTTLSFQISPRLSGSFRYTRIENWSIATGQDTFDRSFDLRYRLVDESTWRPAIAIGLQDMIGTGIYSGEYIVGTKQVAPAVTVTGGIGWGRFGSYEGFDNPLGAVDERFNERPVGTSGLGGQLESGEWFRGDAAFFGGVTWQPTDQLTLLAEYSSDAYVRETADGPDLFERESPLNFGLSYAMTDNASLQAYYLYGSELGAALTFSLNPKEPAIYGGKNLRPTPVVPRAPGAASNLDWTQQDDAPAILRDNVANLLEFEGLTLEAMTIAPTSTTVLFRNDTYIAGSEAIGRIARILTRVMPASVETFTIVPVVDGIKTAAVVLRRSDIEELEFAPDNAWKSYARARLQDAATADEDATYADGLYPSFQWRLGPYLNTSYFDPDSPIRADIGLELSALYDIAPGLTLSGAVRKRIAGNRGDGRETDSVLERVRTNSAIYAAEGDPSINRLTAAYQFNLAPDYYGRVTGGYLEQMFGGLSTEVLWKPVDSRLGLGVEVNYAKQRDFDQLFGFQDYDVVTGHASAYYAFENNLHGQIDVGRYLAGDYGTTLSLNREFDNGWRVGAFATFTDVSAEDFGEGSFDKGLRFSIPLEHFLGTPTRRVNNITLRPLTRDGGARLNISGRLYETVREYHDNDLRGNWGRFWR